MLNASLPTLDFRVKRNTPTKESTQQEESTNSWKVTSVCESRLDPIPVLAYKTPPEGPPLKKLTMAAGKKEIEG